MLFVFVLSLLCIVQQISNTFTYFTSLVVIEVLYLNEEFRLPGYNTFLSAFCSLELTLFTRHSGTLSMQVWRRRIRFARRHSVFC